MSIAQQIQQIQEVINDAEESYQRAPGSVLLLAVSKKHSEQAIEKAFNAGLNNFAENYYQEAEQKIKQLNHLAINWHFIGPIQSNKTKGIAQHFTWVHSINRLIIAEKLNQYRSGYSTPLNVCLQINLVNEPHKSGVRIEQALSLAEAIKKLPHLKLRGLMTIPPPQNNPDEQYKIFLALHDLLLHLNKELDLTMDTLSMGMSNDFIPAIKAGATIIRIGQAIFGERL